MPRRFLHTLLATLAVAGLTVLLTACGGGGSGSETTSSAAGGGGTSAATQSDAVTIKDFSFEPGSLTVKAGTKVTWSNEDSTSHTATADDGAFDTGTIKAGSKLSATLTEPGTYAYVCQFHPFMKGTVTVQG
jgi:plastocyanin